MALQFFAPESEFHITLNIEGATEEDLARGVAAARQVFEEAGVDPWDGAEASHNMEWGNSEDSEMSLADVDAGTVYWAATEAALVAACENLSDTPKKYDFGLRRKDDPPYQPGPEVLEVVRPSTTHGRPQEQLTSQSGGRRRKLVGWAWEWTYLN